jgi:hypothetical protein
MANYINREDLYLHDAPELKERTKARLTQVFKMGMTEVGTAQFGVEGVVSGLYIEKVWRYSEDEWNSYMDWAISVISKDKASKIE